MLLLLGGIAASSWVLTPQGLGPVKLGMSRQQVAAAVGGTLEGAAIESDDICVEKESTALPGVGFMLEDTKLTRISLAEGSRIATLRGIRVGAGASAVREAYGPKLKSEPNTYIEAPAEYLTYWVRPNRSDIRFEVDKKRKVYVIHAGSQSIQYIEGCA